MLKRMLRYPWRLLRGPRAPLDLATWFGLGGGCVLLVFAMLIDADAARYISVSGLLIVMGGTAAATLARFTLEDCRNAIHIAGKAFVRETETHQDLVELTLQQARVVRRSGRLALQHQEVKNAFFRQGLMLCADGCPAEYIQRVLGDEIERMHERHEAGQRLFRAAGEAAPAFGIVGTLVGLVQMLGNLHDPSSIGPAMALALLTTLYGAVIANLVALPIADKLELRSREERTKKMLILEGIVRIQKGEHPQVLRELLEAYVPYRERVRRAA